MTEAEVHEVIELYKQGLSSRTIAQQFGISFYTIIRIMSGKAYTQFTEGKLTGVNLHCNGRPKKNKQA